MSDKGLSGSGYRGERNIHCKGGARLVNSSSFGRILNFLENLRCQSKWLMRNFVEIFIV